jgi:hypothetical protein
MLANWLYLSISNLIDGAQARAIDDILTVSRRLNADLDVTGALILSGSRFAQLIEGPPEHVALLRSAIERDARHRDIHTLEAAEVECRQFADWSLAYSGSSTFVDLELRRIGVESRRDAAGAMRSLKMLLSEFSRAGGIDGMGA